MASGETEEQALPKKSTRRDPRTLTALPDILSCLSALQSEEAEVSDALTNLLNAREPILNSLTRLRSLVPELDGLQSEAQAFSEKVSRTATTADRIGSKVRSLDEEMSRVKEAGDRVNQVIELKSSLSALRASIESHDWEAATLNCSRAMALPLDVISGPFAEQTVPTAESHLPPSETLQEAREYLLSVFRRNFEEASRLRDSTATSRFFKLFPAIGWEAEGLQAYADFVIDLVRVRAPASAKTSSPLYYITSLTSLFESIAMIVDQHQPVVEKYYGTGKMTSVISRLLEECDRVTKSLLEDIHNNPPIPMFTANGCRQQPAQGSEELAVDPREIDKVLSEIAGMLGRWSMFKNFLLDSQTVNKEVAEEEGKDVEGAPAKPPLEDQSKSSLDLEKTGSQKLFNDIILTYFIPFEIWYTRTIVDKAHRMSSPDVSQTPVITTTPDDVFYIFKLVTSRMLSTASVFVVQRTLEQLREVVEKDYIGIIKKKLDDVYRNAVTPGSNVRADKIERENRISFIILLNDLDISASHLDRLTRDLAEGAIITQNFTDPEGEVAKSHILAFQSLGGKFKSTLRSGIEQLFNQLLRPKLRNFIPEIYNNVSYQLDEETYATSDYQDVVRKRFVKTWEGLVDGYKDPFTDNNYRMFFGLALDVLLRPWEKFVLNFKYTELGAIRFDRDLRAITTYLSSQTLFGDVRDKFTRLQQVSTILNLDAEEDVEEFYNSSGITWKITAQEARTIASLKV
ncbi:Conserved oligomeric Golgi complex subunit 4 [Leucoagaricus sp. SymC.cos]|nr:Conserved oligomeric Golgi complex subunit 4 [Leucoagaricus sp. SymC.cos]